MPMTHLNYFWNSFLKEGTWHIYIKGKKDCIIWESFMARNYSSFMHFNSTKMKYNRETYIIMFLDWSQVSISSCELQTFVHEYFDHPVHDSYLPFGMITFCETSHSLISPENQTRLSEVTPIGRDENDRYDKNSSPGICTWPDFKAL